MPRVWTSEEIIKDEEYESLPEDFCNACFDDGVAIAKESIAGYDGRFFLDLEAKHEHPDYTEDECWGEYYTCGLCNKKLTGRDN